MKINRQDQDLVNGHGRCCEHRAPGAGFCAGPDAASCRIGAAAPARRSQAQGAAQVQAVAPADGERRRLLALAGDQGVSRRLVQCSDTRAWTRTPLDDVAMNSAHAELPLAGSDSIPAGGAAAP
jgi:hypothetical protein